MDGNGRLTFASGAVYDLTSNELRPDGWTSADAAGMPILPGLVTYDEVASGSIDHAIRFTAPLTRDEYVWPARHQAGASSSSSVPPMGQRFRLRADFDLSAFAHHAFYNEDDHRIEMWLELLAPPPVGKWTPAPSHSSHSVSGGSQGAW